MFRISSGEAEAQAKAKEHVKRLGDEIRTLKESLKQDGLSNKKINNHPDIKKLVAQLKEESEAAEDFFGQPAFLTVSGQLSAENMCCSLGDVYTFGPTFRAENSSTTRHLAEFWMIEPEMAFADINDDMDCAEDYLKYCVQYAMTHNRSDLEFFDERVEKGLLKRLENLLATPFGRLTYTEAIDILLKESPKAGFQ